MRRTGLVSVGAISVALFSATAHGAAFGLKEHSADAMSAAYAGAAASESDASYLVYNPATLAGVNDFDLSASVITKPDLEKPDVKALLFPDLDKYLK